MDYFNFLAGGAVFGVIAGCWGYIKGFVWKLTSTLIQRVEINDNNLGPTVVGHLVSRYPRSRVYDRVYGSAFEYIKTREYSGIVPYEVYGQRSLILWSGWAPFLLNKAQPKQAGQRNSDDDEHVGSLTLTFVRGTLDVDAIIAEACRSRNEQSWSHHNQTKSEQKRFFIKHVPEIERKKGEENRNGYYYYQGIPWYLDGQHRPLGYRPEELGRSRDPDASALDLLIFPPRVTELVEEIKLWRNNRDWYQKRGIPWKRGWLLYGPPGTGKTALARAFAEDLDMPIFVYNLSELGNFEFMRNWLAMQASAPCVALIEDIDNVFHGRDNVTGFRPRSFMSMLNYGKRSKSEAGEGNDNNNQNQSPQDEHEREFFGGGMLSFDVFLNMLDGVDRNDGVFTVITTNDIAKIDNALGKPRRLPDGTVEFISTRPGRIDKAIELTYMEPADKRRMADRILGEYPRAMSTVLDFLETTPMEETPAQFQERCAQIALRCFWEEQNEQKVLPERVTRARRELAGAGK
jgi:hypothetical protein